MKKLLALLISVFLLCGNALATETAVDGSTAALPDVSTTDPGAIDTVTPSTDTFDDSAQDTGGASPDTSAPYPFVRIYAYSGQFPDESR